MNNEWKDHDGSSEIPPAARCCDFVDIENQVVYGVLYGWAPDKVCWSTVVRWRIHKSASSNEIPYTGLCYGGPWDGQHLSHVNRIKFVRDPDKPGEYLGSYALIEKTRLWDWQSEDE